MAKFVELDDKEFQGVLDNLEKSLDDIGNQAISDMADALLVLARMEVPVVSGTLTKSASANSEEVGMVAFDTEYAAYVHEGMRKDGTHVIKNYSGGRKGKYLESPLLQNISKWTEIAQQALNAVLS